MEGLWDLLISSGLSLTDIETLKHLYFFILMLPVSITIIGLMRYVVGFRSLSVYVPVFLTFAFYEISNSKGVFSIERGLILGVSLFVLTFVSSSLFYTLLKRFRMHYVPKLSIVLTGVAFSQIVLILAGIYFEVNSFLTINPLAIIIMIMAGESIMAILAKKNIRYAFWISLETLSISLISFIFVSWIEFQNFILQTPLVVIVLIVLNIIVGRFLGLRITEYWRFRKLLFKAHPKENDNNQPTTQK